MPRIPPGLALMVVGSLVLAGCKKKDELTTTVSDRAAASGAAYDTRLNPAPVETVGRPPAAPMPPPPPRDAPPAAEGPQPSPPSIPPR